MVALCGNLYHFALGKGIVAFRWSRFATLPFSCFRRCMYEEYYSILLGLIFVYLFESIDWIDDSLVIGMLL